MRISISSKGWLSATSSHRRIIFAVCLAFGLLICAPAASADDAKVVVIKAARLYTGEGAPITNGLVIVRDGQIVAAGADLAIPEGAQVIDLPEGVITPGLIDACCTVDSEVKQQATDSLHGVERYSFWRAIGEIEPPDPNGPSLPGDSEFPVGPIAATRALAPAIDPGISWAEHASEVTPHRLMADSLNLYSNDFRRLLRGGVTTVYVAPDTADVIGARGVVVKTAGLRSQRIVQREAAVTASLGGDPSYRGAGNNLPPRYGPDPNIHTRRPTTRMGVDWVFRKAFYDAKATRDGRAPSGADAPPAEAVPVLLDLLDGKVPLRIHARQQNDIFSALRLAREFGLRFTLEEATEVYRCLPQLHDAGVPVIFGPLYMNATGWRHYSGEARHPHLDTPVEFVESGIEFALTAQELRDEEGLARQAMFAVRHGLKPEQALQAVTATPAKLIGFPQRLGVLTPGADADLVVWNAEPFTATSRPLLVMINGQVVLKDK
ncbi:MAG: amidohydrolase family protein [Phycisphaerae bacterium]|jgi:imidazolonepropionase-like amidohydrolase